MGGGLGGASVALALARKGFRVCLLEEASEFGVIGYGIQLGPNAFVLLEESGHDVGIRSAVAKPS